MAATPFDHALPSASFFNIYNDATLLNQSNNSSLPNGPCNFVDLNQGANGAKCGCRRFWSRSSLGSSPNQPELCACSHHACFHDDFRSAPTPVPENAGQENEKPKPTRDPLSPVQDCPTHMPSMGPPSLDFHTLHSLPAPFSPRLLDDTAAPPSEHPGSNQDHSIPDTMSWGHVVPSEQAPHTTLPPIPAQCLIPSQRSSVSSSTQRYLRPFAGRGLNTLSGVPKPRQPLMEKHPDVPVAAADQLADAQSQGNDHHDSRHPSQPHRTSPAPSERAPLQPISAPSREAFTRLSEVVNGHEQRIDRLETVSFSGIGQEECQEKHDSMDLRITELEVRVEETEKALHDGSAGKRRDGTFDESASSIVSISTNARRADAEELYNQVQILKAQVNQLQTLSPSFGSPWELEIVFLPYPLRGIWMETNEFSTQRRSLPTEHGGEWTQLPNTLSSANLPFGASSMLDWIPPDSGWLHARACAPNRVVDQRLRSRGLIRNVVVRGPDARSVQAAVANTFGNLFDRFSYQPSPRQSYQDDSRLAQFMGLHQTWIPLRKLHKDSRLRFLTKAEMVSPAFWDAKFLSSSVTMKVSGSHRLYITQPAAYLQDIEPFESSWNWQRIRELSRFYSESQNADEVPEADALETHWTWNDRLDEVHTPVTSHHSLSLRSQRLSHISSSPTAEYHTGNAFPSMSSGRGQPARKMPPKPIHVRTTSMPPVFRDASPAFTRRRIISSTSERKISPISRALSIAISKRRQTRSPSMRLYRHTPRYSTTSPSPMAEEHPFHARGVTPGYYATPYSNAPYDGRRAVSRGPAGAGGPKNAAAGYGEGMIDCEYDDEADRGSATDPYDDTDMTQDDGCAAGGGGGESEWHGLQNMQNRQPEDEPWPGIPDHMSDGENIDPLSTVPDEDEEGDVAEMEDVRSQASSQPSEYPSTQSAWRGNGADFRIHEDGDGDADMGALA